MLVGLGGLYGVYDIHAFYHFAVNRVFIVEERYATYILVSRTYRRRGEPGKGLFRLPILYRNGEKVFGTRVEPDPFLDLLGDIYSERDALFIIGDIQEGFIQGKGFYDIRIIVEDLVDLA